jgi:acetyl esterase/lipase
MVLFLHFCSPSMVLNAVAPQNGYTLTHDIAYADGPRHALDIYAPRPSAKPAPVVMYFYGGGWASGSKSMYRFIGAALAARGLVVVIPDYRLYPDVRFPAFVDDAAAAVAWTRTNASRFGGDPHRLFLMGHSAGAQIVTLLALDADYLRSVHLEPQRDLCGIIGLAGPYDFLPLHDATLEAIFGDEAVQPRSQPINFVSPGAPPMLLMAGDNDYTVDSANTVRFADKLRAAGVTTEDHLFPDIGHGTIIAAFSRLMSFLAPVRQDTLSFIAARGTCHG